MSVIERAEQRLNEEERQHELGADNRYDLHYWAAYLDGARAQKKEDEKHCADCQYGNSPWPEEPGREDKDGKAKNGPPVLFSARRWVEREFIKWCEEKGVAKVGNAMVAFMDIHGWINGGKLVEDYRNRDKENVEG